MITVVGSAISSRMILIGFGVVVTTTHCGRCCGGPIASRPSRGTQPTFARLPAFSRAGSRLCPAWTTQIAVAHNGPLSDCLARNFDPPATRPRARARAPAPASCGKLTSRRAASRVSFFWRKALDAETARRLKGHSTVDRQVRF